MCDLTVRQREVAQLVARGLSSKAIAREVGISPATVNDHINGAARRLPGDNKPRHKITLWFLNLLHDET